VRRGDKAQNDWHAGGHILHWPLENNNSSLDTFDARAATNHGNGIIASAKAHQHKHARPDQSLAHVSEDDSVKFDPTRATASLFSYAGSTHDKLHINKSRSGNGSGKTTREASLCAEQELVERKRLARLRCRDIGLGGLQGTLFNAPSGASGGVRPRGEEDEEERLEQARVPEMQSGMLQNCQNAFAFALLPMLLLLMLLCAMLPMLLCACPWGLGTLSCVHVLGDLVLCCCCPVYACDMHDPHLHLSSEGRLESDGEATH
jgi:hypothetical protein